LVRVIEVLSGTDNPVKYSPNVISEITYKKH